MIHIRYNHTYAHGVGRTHAHDHTSGDPVTNFKHSTKLYKRAMRHNTRLDGDKDKIAGERA
jgi:Excalibur calcium-binding domain